MSQSVSIHSTLNLEDLRKGHENALTIEKALLLAQQGKKIDLSPYWKTLGALQEIAAKNKAALRDKKIQVPKGFEEKFIEYEKLIQRIENLAKTIRTAKGQFILPSPSPSEMNAPWKGKLHKGETPLHWAVRHHEYGLAWQLALTDHSSIETVDDLGVTPIDEAILQKDPQMTELLLYPWFVFDDRARENFLHRIHEIQEEVEKMKQVDVSLLSPICRAAYEGDLSQFEEYRNLLDTPDPKTALTPLHYAILGNQQEAIQYLINQGPNFHFLTSKGHSYLDYALLMGNEKLFALFSNLFDLPFRLARQEEMYLYLIATGTLDSYFKSQATARDPIGGGGKDQNLLGLPLNAVWTGSKVLSHLTGTSNLARSSLAWIEGMTYQLNRNATGMNQVLALLPKWVGVAFGIYALTNLSLTLGSSIGRMIPQFLTPTSFTTASSTITSLTNTETIQTSLKIASHVYTALRFVGAVKPVINRIPAYWRTFPSRRFQVLKKVGMDLFNIGSQIAMSLSPFAMATNS